MGKLAVYEKQMLASFDQQISLTDPDSPFDGNQRARVRRRRLQ
jgi:hypothetical protein